MAGGVYVEGEKAEGSADRTTLRAMSLEVTPPDGETQVANSFGNSSRVCGGGVLRGLGCVLCFSKEQMSYRGQEVEEGSQWVSPSASLGVGRAGSVAPSAAIAECSVLDSR